MVRFSSLIVVYTVTQVCSEVPEYLQYQKATNRGGHFRYNSDIPIAIGLSYSYRNIGLTYLSDFNYRTSFI